MFPRLFARRRNNESIAYSLYGAIVAQARQPALYSVFGVPDTVDGRFDMIVLHAFLFLHRLKSATEDQRQIGQAVFDVFLADMDRNLREMGVGDFGVPKKLNKMAESFYGRVGAYDSAIDAADDAGLAEAIERNVFPGSDGQGHAAHLAQYVRVASAALAELPIDDILGGRIAFPDPGEAGRQAAA
ncbi:ubiquinol-cytochrome C chaperone [Kaistia algarum]|uniref:ubiquinol-cytochrome C chaperone family protein n=1 Tax=Kaistia algarum TaxID=2083279 RepID=UPI000CE80B31|nr:ubiquinol-cytochrome C chaperone family protein [Kaistia algarum]MCX5514972.1 ubiquinol-cytochrome C chaperone [Kaistia algarum]PPE79715.1 ubiquinol-cytochrome C chaperone [Kaistia algarum]